LLDDEGFPFDVPPPREDFPPPPPAPPAPDFSSFPPFLGAPRSWAREVAEVAEDAAWVLEFERWKKREREEWLRLREKKEAKKKERIEESVKLVLFPARATFFSSSQALSVKKKQRRDRSKRLRGPEKGSQARGNRTKGSQPSGKSSIASIDDDDALLLYLVLLLLVLARGRARALLLGLGVERLGLLPLVHLGVVFFGEREKERDRESFSFFAFARRCLCYDV
jgi:hypothetical protein